MMDDHSKPPVEEPNKSIEDYSCGWYKDRILIPGRLFIAKTHLTFQPPFGQAPVTIHISEITGLYKKNTAYVFPNAIEIATKTQKYFFGSFYFRDQAFTTLQNLLPNSHVEHDDDDDSSHHSDTSDFYEDEKPRSRASSASDEEEMIPAVKKAAENAFAAMKRTMTKSASERVIVDRSSTPPPSLPQAVVSPARDTSPSASPAPRRREEVPPIELVTYSHENDLDHEQEAELEHDHTHDHDHETSGEVPAYAEHSENNTTHEHEADAQHAQHTQHAHSESNIADSLEMNEASFSHESPSVSPLQSPIIEDYEQQSANTQHAHEHEHELAQEAAEHPTTPPPMQDHPLADNPLSPPPVSPPPIPSSVSPPPVANLPGASTSAPPSPIPNGTSIKKRPELNEKIKLPPIVENCEHMVYPPYSDTFAPFMDESFPCPIQDFYRLVLAGNFWSEVNEMCGYTDPTVTPWLTRSNNSGPCCLYRQINFKMDLTAKIGPKSTRVQQTQRCRLKNSKELILETSSVSADVPYADSFTTDNLLTIKATNNGNSCNLRIACRVNFIKTTWGFGGIIEKSALQGSKDFFATWLVAVRQRIDKEFTKPRSLATPPPTKTPQPSSHQSPNPKSPLHPRPNNLSPATHRSTPNLTTLQTSSPPIPSHVQHKPPPIPAPSSSSAFTPISHASKKFWPTLQQQVSQMSIPVAALCFVVLLIVAIGLPYILYLHARVAHAESHLSEFNLAVGRIENKISFMQLYINYLKENPSSPLPPALSNHPKDDLRTELGGLAHLLEVTHSLEAKMEGWQDRLEGASHSLSSTQELVHTLRSEMGSVLIKGKERERAVEESKGWRGWVYFTVGIITSVGVIGASMYYFRENLPFKLFK